MTQQARHIVVTDREERATLYERATHWGLLSGGQLIIWAKEEEIAMWQVAQWSRVERVSPAPESPAEISGFKGYNALKQRVD